MELPKDIFITASATPPASTAQAAFTLPWRHNWWKKSQAVFSSPIGGEAGQQIHRVPRPLEFGREHFPGLGGGDGEGDQRGGTSRSRKVPDMESLPPMAATSSPSWAYRAPSRAEKGLPQRAGSSRSFSKYSWKVR